MVFLGKEIAAKNRRVLLLCFVYRSSYQISSLVLMCDDNVRASL